MKKGLLVLLVVVLGLEPLRGQGTAFCDSAGSTAGSGNPHDQLRKILNGPLYQRWRLRQERAGSDIELPFSDFLKRTLRRIGDAIEWILDKLFGWLFRAIPPPGSWLPDLSGSAGVLKLIGLISLLLIGIALYMILFLKVFKKKDERSKGAHLLSREQVQEALEAGEALAMDGPEWLREADRLAREGEFRAVYRALYLALLSGLHGAGLIDFRRNRTNWTYVRRFRGSPRARIEFASLTDLFDRVWYGRKTATGVSLDTLRGQVSGLLQEGHGDA